MKIPKFKKLKTLEVFDCKGNCYAHFECTSVEYTPIIRTVKVIENLNEFYTESVFELPPYHTLSISSGHIKIKW